MSVLVSLAVFSGLAANLILQFALGLRRAVPGDESPSPLPLFQLSVLWGSVFFLWAVFFYILIPLGLGFLEYPALFPLSALVCSALELLARRFFPGSRSGTRPFSAVTAYDGLALAALFITLDVAGSVMEALVLSLGFPLGILLSLLLLGEIRRRSALERVPPFLRGSPLALISMAFLSLVFSSVASVLFRILGVF